MIDALRCRFIAFLCRKIPILRNKYFVKGVKMDKTDIKILRHLQKQGRASAQQVADAVGLSAAPVWRRVKALESQGAIFGYYARVNRSEERRVGKECVSPCRVRCAPDHKKK